MASRSKDKNSKAARERFGKRLAEMRKVRGHASAYGFFNGLGARKYFGFNYNHYLMIESGQRLPGTDAMEKILLALFGVGDRALVPERRELAQLYLLALAEGNRVFEIAWSETAQATAAEQAPGEEILKETAKRRVAEVPRLSQEQERTLLEAPETFWCHQWLLQTGRTVAPGELAKALNFDEAVVTQSLERLRTVKILEKTRAGTYRSKLHETDAFFGPIIEPGRSYWLSREIDAARKRVPPGWSSGNHGHFFLALESEKEFELLTELFRETMRKAYLYRRKGPVKGKGFLCSSEWRFFRLFEIPSEE